MKKFIYFDIDGTLLHENKSLTAETVHHLEHLSDIGYGICTNRPLADLCYNNEINNSINTLF